MDLFLTSMQLLSSPDGINEQESFELLVDYCDVLSAV